MELPEIKSKRDNIKLLINDYAKKRYDATVLVNEYERLTKQMEQLGSKPITTNQIYTKDYWENPCHKDREHLNRNPIIGFEDGKPVWKNWQPYTGPRPNKTKPIKTTPTLTNTLHKQVSQPKIIQVVPQNNYYILNIVGLDSFIDATAQFLTDLGLKPIEHSKNRVEWQFNGTDKEFNIVKRATVGLIDNLILDNHIAVYGKKIYDKII